MSLKIFDTIWYARTHTDVCSTPKIDEEDRQRRLSSIRAAAIHRARAAVCAAIPPPIASPPPIAATAVHHYLDQADQDSLTLTNLSTKTNHVRVFSPVSRKIVRITDASESAVALAVGDAVGDVEFDAAGQHPADAINLQWQSSRTTTMMTTTTNTRTVTATAVDGNNNGGNSDGRGYRQQSTKIGSKDMVAVATAICRQQRRQRRQ